MIGSRRLGFRTFEKDIDRIDTSIFSGDLPPGPIGTAAWNHIHLIPPNGATVTSYPVTVAGLLAALTAATVAGSMIWVPPGSFNTAITIPANIALVALGEKVSINGQWTLNSGVVVANVVQTQSGSSAGALSGVVGPSSGIAYMKNCSIVVENSGAGDAYAVNQNAAGELWLWACSTYGNASGGGAGYGARQSAGTLYVSDDGRHRGSTGKFSGTVKLFSLDDVIKLKTSTFTQLYNATAAGVTAMLAAATTGDVVDFPRHKTISFTSGISLTTNVTYRYFNLAFSGFSGIGVTVGDDTDLIDGRVDFNGTGQAVATAISALDVDQTNLDQVRASAHGATTNTGIHARGTTLMAGVHIRRSVGRADGGTNGRGMYLEEFTYTDWCFAVSRTCTSTNYAVVLAGSLSGASAPRLEWCLLYGQNTNGYGLVVAANKYGRVMWSDIGGEVCGVLVNSGAVLEYAYTYWPCMDNNGTIDNIGIGGGSYEYSDADVANPPTEPDLISAFGSPSNFNADGKIGHLNDAGLGLNEYIVVSDGSNFWASTLFKAASGTPSLGSVVETDIAAPAAGEWYGRTNVQELSDGTWVLVYREGTDHAASNDGQIHIRFSPDYGETWTAEDTYLDGNAVAEFPAWPTDAAPGDATWDAGIAHLILAPDGTLFCHMQKVDYNLGNFDGLYELSSTDGGASWSAVSTVTFNSVPGGAAGNLHGDYFIFGGDIYAVGGYSGNDVLFKSTDDGASWTYISTIAAVGEDVVEPAMEYIGNDTIIVIFRDGGNDVTKYTKSTDMGATWAALTDITSAVGGVPLGRPMLYTRSHLKGLANWWNDSVLIMCGFELTTPGSSHERRNAVWVSQDAGDTWTGPLYTDTQQYDGGYGDIAYDPVNDKYVFISYYGPSLLTATVAQYKFTINNI